MEKGSNYTVLVIEDNEINREILNDILCERYRLLFAENGKAGMDIMLSSGSDIDVVLLDIEMPIMNGYEVLEAKREDPVLREIPVIVTTSSDSQADEVKCLELGAQDFVRKPYDPVVVQLRIEAIINLRESNEANRQKALFIQCINHEIRTPMNSIMGFAQILAEAEDGLEPEELKMFCNSIIDNSNALLNMINNMVLLSDLDTGSAVFHMEEVPLNEVCREAMSTASYCKQDGVEVHLTSELGEDYMVYTDRSYLKTAILNYAINANKFTTQGEIDIHSALNEDGAIVISVTDTGIGVDPEKEDFIFHRFNKINSFVPGLGLGLPITRKIARKLGGSAYLDTSYRNGARFVLELPIIKP